jgi:hypothetical protein
MMRTLIIPKDREVIVVVRARIKNESLGGASGEALTLSMSPLTTLSAHAIEARGIATTKTLEQNDGDAVAEGEIVVGRFSHGTNIAITGKTSDTALASIGAVSREGPQTALSVPVGFSTIGAFRIDALPHGNSFHGSNDAIVSSLTFRIQAQNVLIDPLSLRLSTKGNPDAQFPCSAGGSTGSFEVNCSGISGIQHRIGQGQGVIFELKANVVSPSIASGTTSILSAELPTLGQRSVTNSILWNDEVTSFSWVDVPEASVIGTVYGVREGAH